MFARGEGLAIEPAAVEKVRQKERCEAFILASLELIEPRHPPDAYFLHFEKTKKSRAVRSVNWRGIKN